MKAVASYNQEIIYKPERDSVSNWQLKQEELMKRRKKDAGVSLDYSREATKVIIGSLQGQMEELTNFIQEAEAVMESKEAISGRFLCHIVL